MESVDIIGGCITIAIAIASGIYAYFTARKKGPILSNAYLWTSKKEREKIDRDAEYKLMTVIYGGLAVVFLLATISVFTKWEWASILMIVGCVWLTIYAIIYEVKRRS